MFTQFQNYLAKAVGTSAVTVITCPAGVQLTLNGVSVSNITVSPSTPVTVSVIITRNATDIFVVKDATVPAGGSLTCAGEDQRIVMMAGDLLKVVSSRAASVDVVAGGLINDFNPTAPISGPDFVNGVTSGRVFAFDAGNTRQSFIGNPTTNSVPSAATMPSWSNYYRTQASSTFTTEFGTTGYRFTRQPSWNGVARGITLPATGVYTFSARFKYIDGSPDNNGATVYISGWGGGDSAIAVNKALRNEWQRISITLNCTNLNLTFYLISYGGVDNGTGIPDFSSWEVTQPQVEPGSFPTTFVEGTRSATQALLDLTGNTTLTVNNLTYPAANTLGFNGSNSWIESPTNAVFDTQTLTMESWCRPTATSQQGFLFEKGQVNTQYSNFFEGNGIFYFRTIGVSPQDLTITTASFVTANAWNHIVCTLGGGFKRIYVNGVLRAEAASSGTLNTGQTNQYVGKYGNAGNNYPFSGQIAVSKVYNRALTAAEVLLNFNALRVVYGL
jgi:hypothetical protein